MSELKGQLLGMVLVLAVFGVVAAALVPAVQKTADQLESEMGVNVSQVESEYVEASI